MPICRPHRTIPRRCSQQPRIAVVRAQLVDSFWHGCGLARLQAHGRTDSCGAPRHVATRVRLLGAAAWRGASALPVQGAQGARAIANSCAGPVPRCWQVAAAEETAVGVGTGAWTSGETVFRRGVWYQNGWVLICPTSICVRYICRTGVAQSSC